MVTLNHQRLKQKNVFHYFGDYKSWLTLLANQPFTVARPLFFPWSSGRLLSLTLSLFLEHSVKMWGLSPPTSSNLERTPSARLLSTPEQLSDLAL